MFFIKPSIPINGGWIFAGSKALQEETVEVCFFYM